MKKLTKIFTAEGRQETAKALSVQTPALSMAEKANICPASWYLVINAIADKHGIDIPDGYFNFKSVGKVKKN